MEDALSLMASSVAEQAVNSMALTSDKLGNNNTLELVGTENQENNLTIAGTTNHGQGDSTTDIGKTFLNMQGLGDQSFMAGMGGGMFADGGPLLPSLMSPMMPGSQMGGMLGTFPGMNSNLMQNNMGNATTLGGVNGGGNNNTQHQNVNSVQPFNTNYSHEGNLFPSPVTVGSSSSSVSSNSSVQLGIAQNSSNNSSSVQTSQPQADVKTSNSLSQLTIKPESSEQSALQMISNTVHTTQAHSAIVTSVPAQDSHLPNNTSNNVGSIALFTQPSSMQQPLNSSAANTSIQMSSTTISTPSSNVHLSTNIGGTNFINIGGGGGNNHSLQLHNNTVSNSAMVPGNNTATVAANGTSMVSNHKGLNNVVNNIPILGHPQVGTVQQQQQQTGSMTQLNQNVTIPQVQGTTTLGPVAPLQGTLVLHNNQLILVPNNQQQQPVVNAPGITVNQNLPGSLVNQTPGMQQVIGGNLQGLGSIGGAGGGGAGQAMLNAGIQSTNQLTGVQASMAAGMQNVLGISTQSQGLQKSGVIANTAPRLGLGQQQVIGNAQGTVQTNPGGQVIPGSGMQGSSNTGTVQVNTPTGVVQMNTAPSAPNQLPSALILPNGQIVPVVTQPNVIPQQQQQQALVQAGGNNLVLQGNQMTQQAGTVGSGQLTIQTPSTALGGAGNQIIGCSVGGGTGLLMTTASSQIIRQTSVNSVASNIGLKTLTAQPNTSMQYIQGGGSVLPGGTGLLKGPMIAVTSKAQPILAQTAKPVATSKISTKSSSSKSKSKKGMMTSLPTTVQAMLTPEGNIILSLPAGAAAGKIL